MDTQKELKKVDTSQSKLHFSTKKLLVISSIFIVLITASLIYFLKDNSQEKKLVVQEKDKVIESKTSSDNKNISNLIFDDSAPLYLIFMGNNKVVDLIDLKVYDDDEHKNKYTLNDRLLTIYSSKIPKDYKKYMVCKIFSSAYKYTLYYHGYNKWYIIKENSEMQKLKPVKDYKIIQQLNKYMANLFYKR